MNIINIMDQCDIVIFLAVFFLTSQSLDLLFNSSPCSSFLNNINNSSNKNTQFSLPPPPTMESTTMLYFQLVVERRGEARKDMF